MNTKNLVLSATLLAASLIGTAEVSAQEYEDATTAKVDSSITFIVDDNPDNPVDPNDPDTPVIPEDPTNPNGGELMITYASNLNFGNQEKSGTSWNALSDTVDGGTAITPFVGTKDSRGTDRQGWVLTAKQDDSFKDAAGNELTGAELVFSNLFYASKEGAPVASSGEITLNNVAQDISTADSSQGVGSWSVGLGQLGQDGKTNGVTLNVPSTTAKNTGAYTTTVTWELTADPSI